MVERIDTGGKGLRVGQYTFTVSENPVKGEFSGGTVYYEWFFTTFADGEIKEHKERIPVWKMGPLLRVLGQKEVQPDVFEWDRDNVKGLKFDAEIMMERDRKDPTKAYARITNHRKINADESAVPF